MKPVVGVSFLLASLALQLLSPLPEVEADTGDDGFDFPQRHYFLKKARFFDGDGFPRAAHSIGRWQAEWEYEESYTNCTTAIEAINGTVETSHGYCGAWDTAYSGRLGEINGNCSCTADGQAGGNGEYCTEWYCQKTTVLNAAVSYDWERCQCQEAYTIGETSSYGLSCKEWDCDEGTAADASFAELWNNGTKDQTSEWECSVTRFHTDLTGAYCNAHQGGELQEDHHFSMTGCQCTWEAADQDYCLSYGCKTYRMHKCDSEWNGCGELGQSVPVIGFFGGIFFVLFCYAMFFSGPKNSIWDNMGCFDIEWYDGLGCWFNCAHACLSGAFCCHILVWALPVWIGGCGAVGAGLLFMVAYWWTGIWGLIATSIAWSGCLGLFKFCTPRLYPHCRLRLHRHAEAEANWHINFKRGGYVEVPHKKRLGFEHAHHRTLEFWIRPHDHHPATLFEKIGGQSERGRGAVNFRLDMDGKGRLWLHSTSRRASLADAGAPGNKAAQKKEERRVTSWSPLPRHRWTHVALVHDHHKKHVYFFLNGDFDSEHAWVPGPENEEPLLVCHGDKKGWFHGRLAEVRMWRRRRSPEQIKANMHKHIRGLDKDLVLYLRLNEDGKALGDSPALTDRSRFAVQAELRGAARRALLHAPKIAEEPVFPAVPLAKAGPEEATACWKAEGGAALGRLGAVAYDFTLELWCRADPGPTFEDDTQCLLDTGSGGFGLERRGRRVWLFMGANRYNTGLNVEPGEWTHLAIQVDGDLKLTGFCNGEKVGKVLIVKPCKIHPGDPLTLGHREQRTSPATGKGKGQAAGGTFEATDFWDGSLAEVRIWARARGKYNIARQWKTAFVDDLEDSPLAGKYSRLPSNGPELTFGFLGDHDMDLVGCWKLFDHRQRAAVTRVQPGAGAGSGPGGGGGGLQSVLKAVNVIGKIGQEDAEDRAEYEAPYEVPFEAEPPAAQHSLESGWDEKGDLEEGGGTGGGGGDQGEEKGSGEEKKGWAGLFGGGKKKAAAPAAKDK